MSPDVVMLAGDWHGNTNFAIAMIEAAAYRGVKQIVHLGDFGIWPGQSGDKYLKALRLSLEKHDVEMWVVPGNHEDYNQIDAVPIDPETGRQHIRNKIHLLPRGYRWKWNDHVWLALGGATSLDRLHRVENHSWWPQEAITVSDAMRAVDGGKVDVMVTHDCPAGINIPNIPPDSYWNPTMLAEANTNRSILRDVLGKVRPFRLFHGHFHSRYSATVIFDAFKTEDPDHCMVIGLDCETSFAANTFFLDTKTLEEWTYEPKNEAQ